jgi:hypothetical protein
VHDRRAAPDRAADGSQVQDIRAVGPVETSHLVPAACQEARYPDTHGTPISSDQNAHPAIIPPDRYADAAGQLPTRASASAAQPVMLPGYSVDEMADWGRC